MGSVMQLGPADEVAGRPFAHPGRISSDVTTLRHMIDQLRLYLEGQQALDQLPRPVVLHRPSREQWIYRLVIARPEHLLAPGELTIVGFLGQRRIDANLALANEFDQILVSEIPEHPGLLSYSTMAMISGDFSNLVVFSNPGVKERWSRSKAHAQAVNSLSPNYYESVCLYNGKLPNGIAESQSLYLTKIKYFDYQSKPWWRAERIFPGDA